MRYLIITYVGKPNGQIDEQVQLSNRVRDSDIQMANVIMDFKEKKIIKCSIQGTVLTNEWDKLRDYYHEVYSDVIDKMEAENAPTE
jgi:hypothetical protein